MAQEGASRVGPQELGRSGWSTVPGWLGGGLDRVLILVTLGCSLLTLAIVVSGIHGHGIVPAADLFIDTVALVVGVALTALAWARFRERHLVAAVYQAAAFLALAVAYGVAVAVTLEESLAAGALAEPRDAQSLVFAAAELSAAMLFVASATSSGLRPDRERPALVLLVGPVAILAALAIGSVLPSTAGLLQVIDPTETTGLPTIAPLGVMVHLLTGTLFFVGASASRALFRRGLAVIDAWIAVGLVFLAFAQLNLIAFPRAHPGQISVADLMMLAGWLVLLTGLVGSVRAGLEELRDANLELRELRDAEVERASLEERARLARELHDGLAQDLWLAKLRTGELAAMQDLGPDVRRAAQEALSAIDAGLGDAREAVAALRSPSHSDSGFCALVRRQIEDFGDRFGLRAEFVFEGDHTTRIAPRTQAEILRITQEALMNVARHADATVVGARLVVRDERITLRIVDNGCGFDATAAPAGSFGIATMRERAALIGGRLRVASRLGSGTLIVLMAPFGQDSAAAGAGVP
jgi:signal transduction histidine kinase